MTNNYLFTIKDKDGRVLPEPTEFMNRPENLAKIKQHWKHSMALELCYGYTYEYLLTLSMEELDALWQQEEERLSCK
jgi:hypothetical protein